MEVVSLLQYICHSVNLSSGLNLTIMYVRYLHLLKRLSDLIGIVVDSISFVSAPTKGEVLLLHF